MKTRVMHVVLSLAPGGTERLVIDLATRLQNDYRMSVCCLDEPGAWAHELIEQGISVTSLGRGSGFRPGFGRRLADVAAHNGAHILHCHHYSPFVYSALARLWHPCRIIFTEHGRAYDSPPSRKRHIANRVLRYAPSGVYAVSDDLKRHMVSKGSLRRGCR